MAEVKRPKPPSETADEIWTRSWIITSFWAVVLLLGVPAWWHTTMIYRASLPAQEMNEWADGKSCRIVFPLLISMRAPTMPDGDAQHLVRLTQHALDDLDNFSAHHLRLDLESNRTVHSDVALYVNLTPMDISGAAHSLHQHEPILDILFPPSQIPPLSASSAPLARHIADTLQELFAEERETLNHVLARLPGQGAHQTNGQGQARSSTPEFAAELAKRSTRALKYAPTYHLTFSLFTPSALPSTWDIDTAVEEYVQPLLQSLSPLSNFTVDSQVQLYARFSQSMEPPRFDEISGQWTLSEEMLSGFINAAEWPLTPSIGSAPTINFILYVPDPKHTPLVVGSTGGNSWLIPQWGGVFILNGSPDRLSAQDLEPALLTFTQQLLSLLGVPRSPNSLPLQILALVRMRSASLLLSAASTLGSLSRLVVALPSISIPSSVAHSVDRTISHLHSACADLKEGRFQAAMDNARSAEAEAEKGFFEKSMVGQVYFPDEHKIAVYMPMLGPVCVPLVMALFKELKRRRTAWRQAGTASSDAVST